MATIINMINVFNSFPIIWVMTNGGPGFQTDTTTTFMYKLAFRFQDMGQSAAMAVINFGVILVFVAVLPARRGLAEGLSDDEPDATRAAHGRRCARVLHLPRALPADAHHGADAE